VALVALTGCVPGFGAARFAQRSLRALVSPARPAPMHAAQPFRRDARLAVTWIGHATALIQMDDVVILTDPVFTERVGGLSARLVEPGLRVAELPPIDVALVSHMHFDHLSFDSLRRIASRTRTLLLPAGGGDYVHAYSFDEVELAPWQRWTRGDLKVTAVPVKHVGWRFGIDALWHPHTFTGYVIQHRGLTVYFGGDSALDLVDLRAVHARFPKIDLALLPIGPIAPRHFMAHTHMDPAEALRALRILDAARMVPIHYGTFVNSGDEPGDVVRALRAALDAQPDLRGRVTRLQIGEQRVFMGR